MNKNTIITIVVIVVIVVIAAAVLLMGNHGTPAQQAAVNNPAGQQAPAPTPYAASADGFSVTFPSAPQVTSSIFQSPSAGSMPLTKYEEISMNGISPAYYAVYVYHYPATYKFPANYLSGAVQVFAKAVNEKYPGARLANETSSQLSGNPAMMGIINLPAATGGAKAYATVSVKNGNTYFVGSYGVPQSDYTTFVNSFSFTQ